MSSDAEIVAKVARRAADPERRIDGEPLYDPPPPLSEPGFLVELERELGFALPGLLKILYLQVGDGGFGPGFGLFGARSGHYLSDEPFTLAALYRGALHARRWHDGTPRGWREGMLPICEWGCSYRGCIDCTGGDYWVFTSDSDTQPVSFYPEGRTFRDWVETWADGVDVTPRGTAEA